MFFLYGVYYIKLAMYICQEPNQLQGFSKLNSSKEMEIDNECLSAHRHDHLLQINFEALACCSPAIRVGVQRHSGNVCTIVFP